jgi:SAM-dependent methyltransferase
MAEYRSAALACRRYLYPMSANKAASLLGALDLGADALIVDLGCGNGGLLLDAVADRACRGVGVEANGALLDWASAEIERLGAAGRVQLIQQTPKDYQGEAGLADAVICIGGRASFGDLHLAAAKCFELLRVGGRLLLGEFYWRKTPPAAYRDVLESSADSIAALGANAHITVSAGFEQQLTALSSESEWDEYETACYRCLLHLAEQRARDGLDEGASLRLFERAQALYQAYWRYGRDALGFGMHLFRKPRRPIRLIGS